MLDVIRSAFKLKPVHAEVQAQTAILLFDGNRMVFVKTAAIAGLVEKDVHLKTLRRMPRKHQFVRELVRQLGVIEPRVELIRNRATRYKVVNFYLAKGDFRGVEDKHLQEETFLFKSGEEDVMRRARQIVGQLDL